MRYPDIALYPDTRLLIEGYCRSASSFAAECFRYANGQDVKLVWNMHSAGSVVEAKKWKIPTILLIRAPKDVALSTKLMNKALPFKIILDEYIKYYRFLYRYRNHFIVATRDQVNSDFGKVIKRTNNRYGTQFKIFKHTKNNSKRVIALMKKK